MNPILTGTSLASMPHEHAGVPLSLAERVLAQGRIVHASAAASDDAEAGQGDVTPLPRPISEAMQGMVRDWARQVFMEQILYGEEEETGITPLSIDI